jgi:hypothetical protein
MKTIEIIKVWVDEVAVYIQTSGGETKRELFNDYVRLRNATPVQQANFEYDNIGIHWNDIDEDLSFEGFFDKENKPEKSELYNLFKSVSEINVSSVARRMGIPQSVMASYMCGAKKPSESRKAEIENTLHQIGKELLAIHLTTQNVKH